MVRPADAPDGVVHDLDFKPISEQYSTLLRKYYSQCTYRLCEYSLGVKLMWRRRRRGPPGGRPGRCSSRSGPPSACCWAASPAVRRGCPAILRGLRAFLYLLTALVMAGSLNIDVSSLIALVGVFGLAVSLAVQDVLGNVAGGMVLLFSKPFTLGDYVSTADGEGEVAEITLTHTKLDTPSGQRVMLPNSRLTAGQIVNYTVRGVRRGENNAALVHGFSPLSTICTFRWLYVMVTPSSAKALWISSRDRKWASQ